MSLGYKLVIFDLDDTLISTKDAYFSAYRQALSKMLGLSPELVNQYLDSLLPIYGSSKSGYIFEAVAQLENKVQKPADKNDFEQIFESIFWDELQIFDGVLASLDRYKAAGAILAICSNGYGPTQRHKLKSLKLYNYFLESNIMISLERTREKAKPFPDMLNHLLKKNSLEAVQSCFYGNSIGDYLSAKTAGIDFIMKLDGYEKIFLNSAIKFETAQVFKNWSELE